MGKRGQSRRRLAAVIALGLASTLPMAGSGAATTPGSGGQASPILRSAPAPAAVSSHQIVVHRFVNGTRSDNRLSGLRRAESAMAAAQTWAERLRNCQCLRHRSAPFAAPTPWYAAAENVGRGYTLTAVHKAFLRSPPHRANILTARMTHIATGVARDADGEYFVVQAFYDLR